MPRTVPRRRRERRGDAGQRSSGPLTPLPVAKNGPQCHNRLVPVEGHVYGERTWFYDTRSPVRRMGVSTHGVDSTMVISLWQGDMCTGTFRLPAKEGARLISTLAYGMTEAISDQGPTHEGKPDSFRKTWSRVARRLLSRTPVKADTTLRLLK